MKKKLQHLIRFVNKTIFKNELPKKISIYFHDIDEQELISIKNIILFFKSLNYQFVTVEDFNNLIETDKKLLSLTFDDGFAGWLKLLPIFQTHNVQATFFTNSIFLSDENLTRYLRNININSDKKLISETGIKKLVKDNHEIGAHTHTHYTLSNLSFDEFVVEDSKNRNRLEEFAEIKNFAIPYGMRRYLTDEQKEYLEEQYNSISFGEPGMQFKQEKNYIQRYPWLIEKSFFYNLENICTNTSYFNNLTLRSGLG